MNRFKKKISFFIIFMFIINFFNIVPTLGVNIHSQNSQLLQMETHLDKENYNVNEEFSIRYRITPEPIKVKREPEKPKEIVLVIDTSGSMDWTLDGREIWYDDEKSRSDIASEAAKSFIDKFIENENKNVKIALVPFSNYAYKPRYTSMGLVEEPYFQDYLKADIDELNNNYGGGYNSEKHGATNIGDGLRRAYHILDNQSNADKYIILLSDGVPTAYTRRWVRKNRGRGNNKGKWEYEKRDNLYGHDNEVRYYTGSNDPDEYAINYAKEIGNMIKEKEINTFVVGFSDSSISNKLQQITTSCGGQYEEALSEVQLNDSYNDLADTIGNEVVLKDLKLKLALPNGIELGSNEDSLSQNGQTVEINADNVVYKFSRLEGNEKVYEAESFDLDLKLKGVQKGSYDINSTLTYKDNNNISRSISIRDSIEITSGSTDDNEDSHLLSMQTYLDKNNFDVNEEFSIKYTVNPEPIKMQRDLPQEKQKEIVLVMDTSGSMDWTLDGRRNKHSSEKSRSEIAKDAAKGFIDNFKDNKNVKIALVPFASYAYKTPYSDMRFLGKDYFEHIKYDIQYLNNNGATNIGDGLRMAYNKLNNNSDADKYIILLSDGVPTAYTYRWIWDDNSRRYKKEYETRKNLYGNNNDIEYYNGSSDPYGYALEYSTKIGEMIKNTDINTFVIGFSDSSISNRLQEITRACGGEYKEVLDEIELNTHYDDLADTIDNEIVLKNLKLNVTLPEDIEIGDNEGIVSQNGQTTEINVNNVVYKYSRTEGNKKIYEAEPFDTLVKFKGKKKGNYTIESTLNYMDNENTLRSTSVRDSIVINEELNTQLELKGSVDRDTFNVGEVFKADYSIKPLDVGNTEGSNGDGNTENGNTEIVFVVDTSHSMVETFSTGNSSSNGNGKDKDNVKVHGKVNPNLEMIFKNLKDKSNVSIGVVNFSNYAYHGTDWWNSVGMEPMKLYPSSEADKFIEIFKKNTIEKDKSNIGDGIRAGYYMLDNNSGAKKYIVLITDGVPNMYSYRQINWDDSKREFITDNILRKGNENNPFYINEHWNMNENKVEEKALEYAKVIGNMIKKSSDIETLIVSYKNNDNRIIDIAKSCDGQIVAEVNNNGSNSDWYNNVIDNLSIDNTSTTNDNGHSRKSIKNIKFEQVIPEGLEIEDVQGEGITHWTKTEDGKVEININQISYNLNNNIYTSNDIRNFSITYRAKEAGDYTLQGKLDYKNFYNKQESHTFNSIEIHINEAKQKSLDILEIQPTNNFQLNKQNIYSSKYNVENINITHMSITQFISTVEEVNGKYDIVYIGENSGQYSAKGNIANCNPDGNLENPKEYFSEIDITNRKAEDINDYVESGQLLVIDNSIFQRTNTKIENNLQKYKNENNLMKISSFDIGGNRKINLDNIINKYNELHKRPLVDIVDKPKEYSDYIGEEWNGLDEAFEVNKTMTFKFDIYNLNMNHGQSNPMTINLYLDINGDGLFKGDEKVETLQYKNTGEGYVLNHKLQDGFSGLMPWKIEIIDQVTGTKVYRRGNTAFEGKKLNVRVLHLIPDSGTNLSLNGSSFKPPLNTDRYNINVTELKVGEFSSNYPNEVTVDGKVIQTQLNGNYDMIILGFGDMYGSCDIRNDKAIEAIKDFIRTGQSVMFTHDTMTFQMNEENTWCYNLTKEFRDIIGQSRYIDPYNPEELDVNGEKIIHDPYPGKNNYYGFSNGVLKRYNSGHGDKKDSELAYKLNEGLITTYPYVLPQDLRVATTHQQYYQLNLEDEEVIPWYTLDGPQGYYNKFDGRNDYYTYSKGNITFSGTGHSSPNGEQEQKLFINTIVKASRGANHAPTVEVGGVYDNMHIDKNHLDINFDFIADDVDKWDRYFGAEIYVNDVKVADYPIEDKIIEKGSTIPVSISEKRIKSIINSDEFTVTIKVWDKLNAAYEKSFNVQLVDLALNLQYENNNKDGYLVGDRAQIKVDLNYNKSDKDITLGDFDFELQYDNDGISGLTNKPNWQLSENIVFKKGKLPVPAKQESLYLNPLITKANKEGLYKIDAAFKYKYINTNTMGEAKNQILIPVKEGKIDVSVLDRDGKAIPGAKIILNRKDNSTTCEMDSHTSNGNGIVTFNTVNSGNYELVLELPEKFSRGYKIQGGNNKTINLSYTNSYEKIEFKIVDDISNRVSYEILYSAEDWKNNNKIVTWKDPNEYPIWTNDKVTTTLKVNKHITILNSEAVLEDSQGNYYHEFSENGEFVFMFSYDGITYSAKAEVKNIDKTPPTAKVIYKINEDGYDVSRLIPSEEGIIVTNNKGAFDRVFTSPGSFTYKFTDKAGNTGSAEAVVKGSSSIKLNGYILDGKLKPIPDEFNVVRGFSAELGTKMEIHHTRLKFTLTKSSKLEIENIKLLLLDNNGNILDDLKADWTEENGEVYSFNDFAYNTRNSYLLTYDIIVDESAVNKEKLQLKLTLEDMVKNELGSSTIEITAVDKPKLD